MNPGEKQKYKARNLTSEGNLSTWAKKRAAFFATNPKCKTCGNAIDHYSKTMECRKCQIDKNRKARKKEEAVYQRKYYKAHKEAIAKRTKVQYQNSRW